MQVAEKVTDLLLQHLDLIEAIVPAFCDPAASRRSVSQLTIE